MCLLMSNRLMNMIKDNTVNEEDNPRFCRQFIHLFKKIYKLDKIKRLDPLFSVNLSQFAMYILTNKDELLHKDNRSSEKYNTTGF